MNIMGGDGYNKKVAVLGGNGFIGHHIARRYKEQGWYVLVVDIKECEYGNDHATDITIGDLRNQSVVETAISSVHLVIQLAADMGGCQYIFSGDHDADVMRNSAQINLNVCDALVRLNPTAKVFYSSSACMYPQGLQGENAAKVKDWDFSLSEDLAYPASPDSEYGWEKLFSERVYLAYARNYGLDVRIARFHNIYGPEGIYKGGKEKAPASISRKVAEANKIVDCWGSGNQTRSFLYIEDCLDAVQLLMKSDFKEPINIGSEEMVSILELWKMAIEISGKRIAINHVPMPKNHMGVKHRNSNNDLIREKLGWSPKYTLREGLEKTYHWIEQEIKKNGI
jgi:GDP-D-mannose 3', 5'-epimerase